VIEIATTATLRAEIFHRTFESFRQNLFGSYDQNKLIVNLDFVGDVGTEQLMMKEFDYFFGPRVQINLAKTANFMKAIMWVWSHTTSKYVMQIEDDWEMLLPMDFSRMVEIMDNHRNLAVLRLPRWKSETKRTKQWNKWFVWNGTFFECPSCMRHRVGYSGNPALIRKEFMDGIVKNIWRPTGGPEQQLNNTTNSFINNYLKAWTYGVYQEPDSPLTVVDIGREWRKDKNLKKNHGTRFYQWTR
jgi:hypothetical protein